MKRKLFSLTLVLILCLGLCTSALAAQTPVQIYTPADLLRFAKQVAQGENPDAVLMADLDLSSMNWEPIAVNRPYSGGYAGTFDGNGHTIRNLYTTGYLHDIYYAGFFGFLGPGGVIRDLALEINYQLPYYRGYAMHVGGLAYCSEGQISGCTVTGVINVHDGMYAGGLVGELNGGGVSECSCAVDITNIISDAPVQYGHYNTGGVVGAASHVYGLPEIVIDRCQSSGSITVSGGVPSCDGSVGGVAGSIGFDAEVKNCWNSGQLQVSGGVYSNLDTLGKQINAGGIAGKNTASHILNCFNTGEISVEVNDGIGAAVNGIARSAENCWTNARVTCIKDGVIQNSFYSNNALSCYYLDGVSSSCGTGRVLSVQAFADGSLVELLNSYIRQDSDRGLRAWAQGPSGPVFTDNTQLPAPSIAYASTQTVRVDGAPVKFQCYALRDENGNPTNYVKLRDLALVLSGTPAQFEVVWNGSINLVTGAAYTPNGSEQKTPFSGDRVYELNGAETRVNGMAVKLDAIVLKDDAGGDYTYYKLRDLGRTLGFNVGWNEEWGVFLETDRPYSDND